MKLSVIVPVFNMASDERLNWCLDSLVGQEGVPDYEILAVDDCSTDESARILQTYEEHFPDRIRALRGDRNRRQGGAKNLGLSRARGEWIAFIDADDWVVPDYFARLLRKAEETGADCVGTDYCIVQTHTMEPGPVVANSRPEQAGIVDDVRRRSLLVDFGSLCVKIYRREIVYGTENPPAGAAQEAAERIFIFPEDMFYEDNAVAKTWAMRIRHFEYVPGPLYYYYQHGDSTVHTVSPERLRDRMMAGRLMVDEARRRGYLESYRGEIEYAFTVLFYKNTLFGAMQSLKGRVLRRAKGTASSDGKRSDAGSGAKNSAEGTVALPGTVYGFATALAREMKETFPDFQENPYYLDRTDEEEKRLIAMQMTSPAEFYIYYRLLWLYRRLRYGGSRGPAVG